MSQPISALALPLISRRSVSSGEAGGRRGQSRCRRGLAATRLRPSFIPVSPPPPLQEFVHLAKRLVSDPALEKGIVANGREYVRTFHSWQAERATYQHLVRTLGGSED